MSSLLLEKSKLDSTWIDCGPGEPYIIRSVLEKHFDLESQLILKDDVWEYPSPNGIKPLIDFLENKYSAPVVITNGAKGGLAATFYALKKMKYDTVEMRNPYWTLIPPLAEQHGLACKFTSDFEYSDPYLCLNPNNPDGFTLPYDKLSSIYNRYAARNIPFIHDAAYYSHIYLSPDYELKPIGDVAIYSASKSYGLSGIRVGYCVCYNTDYYNYFKEYQEMMTVGVSTISQEFFYNLLTCIEKHPFHFNDFIFEASKELYDAKIALKKINPQVLEVPDNFEFTDGMFAFMKTGPKANFEAAKVNVIDGKYFGMPEYVRLNLAIGKEKIEEVVNRLNALC